MPRERSGTTKLCWVFHPKSRTEPERNPTRGEHFRRNAERGPASMIVREGVQNALDARRPDLPAGEPVRVRIHVSGADHAVAPGKLGDLMTDEFVRHLRAPAAGLIDPPGPDAPCPYLVFEDFGTTGLTGSVTQHAGKLGEVNRFYYFLRAEGANDKHGGELGSWGVGKTVFPSASKINTMLIRSVRERDEARPVVVMGRTILRYHELDGRTWRPDAWLGISDGEERFALPGDDASASGLFQHFSLTRGTEPGLSIIVPHADLDEIDYQLLVSAMLEEYAFCIADGSLLATIETPEAKITIDRENIVEALETILDERRRAAIAPIVRAARNIAAINQGEKLPIVLNDPWPYHEAGRKGAVRWEELEWLDEPTKDAIASILSTPGDAVTIRVPIRVEPKHGGVEESSFLVYLEADPEAGNVRPACLREGLLIPGTSGDRPDLVTGLRSVIYAGRGPLANLLRAAEDPSHMTWSHRTENFKETYKYPRAYLNFVRSAPKAIVRLVRGDEDEEDPDLFRDLISIVERRPRRRKRPRKWVPPEPPKKPSLIVVEKRSGGFRVTKNTDAPSPPAELFVRCAYDCDERDPFKMYEPFDFSFERSDLDVQVAGCVIAERGPNHLRVDIQAPDFEVLVAGFDEQRDLIVRTQARLDVNESSVTG